MDDTSCFTADGMLAQRRWPLKSHRACVWEAAKQGKKLEKAPHQGKTLTPAASSTEQQGGVETSLLKDSPLVRHLHQTLLTLQKH